MQTVDYIVAAPLLYGMYIGYQKGFLLMVMGVIALVAGVGVSFKLLTHSIRFFMNYLPHLPEMVPFLAFTVVFILVSIGTYYVAVAIKKAMDFTFFAGVIDNVVGALVGLFQWAFMVSVLLWLNSQTYGVLPKAYFENSVLAPPLKEFAPYVVAQSEFVLPFMHDLFQSISQIFLEL